MSTPQSNVDHYGVRDLVPVVTDALRQAGFGEAAIQPASLAPLDQFHVGGAAASMALADKLALSPGSHVLDVGCGLGGPARYLASAHQCQVTGVDLSQNFIDLATMLTQRTGLAETVRHIRADATNLPFEAASFDHAWTQHVAMNISDRPRLYSEIFRVLRPGGRLAMYDVVAGNAEPLHFPVPWARDPTSSFLLTPDATRHVLETVGFIVRDWVDATGAGVKWAQEQVAAGQNRPDRLRAIALPLVMGSGFPTMVANLQQNLREGRVRLLQAVVERPA